jgi:hypothetical protein
MHSEPAVPDRVHPAMNRVERPSAQPHFDRAPANPTLSELPARHDPMLALGERRDDSVHPQRIALTAAFAVYVTVNAAVSAGGSGHAVTLTEWNARVARRTRRI